MLRSVSRCTRLIATQTPTPPAASTAFLRHFATTKSGGKMRLQHEEQSTSHHKKSASPTPTSSSASTTPPAAHTSPSTTQSVQAAKTKRGVDASTAQVTPTPLEAQQRKASGKSAVSGDSPVDVHRRQEDYTKRDSGTGAEQNVAADRAAHDPLPDHEKHSAKSKRQ